VIADVWVKVRVRYCGDVPSSERYTSAATLKRMRSGTCSWPVEADQGVGDVGNPTKTEKPHEQQHSGRTAGEER
jgi:hypothetical protein